MFQSIVLLAHDCYKFGSGSSRSLVSFGYSYLSVFGTYMSSSITVLFSANRKSYSYNPDYLGKAKVSIYSKKYQMPLFSSISIKLFSCCMIWHAHASVSSC